MSEPGGIWWIEFLMKVNSPDPDSRINVFQKFINQLRKYKHPEQWAIKCARSQQLSTLGNTHKQSGHAGRTSTWTLHQQSALHRPHNRALLFFRGLSHTLKAVKKCSEEIMNSVLPFNTFLFHTHLRVCREMPIGEDLVIIFWPNSKGKNITIFFPVMLNFLGVEVHLFRK